MEDRIRSILHSMYCSGDPAKPSQLRQHHFEIVGQLRSELDVLVAAGQAKPQGLGMEELAVQATEALLAEAVDRISGQGVADGGKVDAHLMGAAGSWLGFYQSVETRCLSAFTTSILSPVAQC